MIWYLDFGVRDGSWVLPLFDPARKTKKKKATASSQSYSRKFKYRISKNDSYIYLGGTKKGDRMAAKRQDPTSTPQRQATTHKNTPNSGCDDDGCRGTAV